MRTGSSRVCDGEWTVVAWRLPSIVTDDDRARVLLAVQRHAPFGDTIAPRARNRQLLELVDEGLVRRTPPSFTTGYSARFRLTAQGEAWLVEHRLRRPRGTAVE